MKLSTPRWWYVRERDRSSIPRTPRRFSRLRRATARVSDAGDARRVDETLAFSSPDPPSESEASFHRSNFAARHGACLLTASKSPTRTSRSHRGSGGGS